MGAMSRPKTTGAFASAPDADVTAETAIATGPIQARLRRQVDRRAGPKSRSAGVRMRRDIATIDGPIAGQVHRINPPTRTRGCDYYWVRNANGFYRKLLRPLSARSS